jgi:hypothetical protein
MQRLRREHDGHYVEIAGTAIVQSSPFAVDEETSTTNLGPVKIEAGSRVESGPVQDPPRPIRLKVESLTHLEDLCVEL